MIDKKLNVQDVNFATNDIIDSGTITLVATNTLTTEVYSSDILPKTKYVHVSPNFNSLYCLQVQKAQNDTASDLTVNIYNLNETMADTSGDILKFKHTSHVVEESDGVATYRDFLVRGLFIGTESKVSLGFAFAADSETGVKVYYRLYKV